MNIKEVFKEKIEFLYDTLSKSEKEIANLLLNDLEHLEAYSIMDIAQQTGVSKPTIVRLFQRIGYTGFREFRRELLSSSDFKASSENTISETDETQAIMSRLIEENIKIMTSVSALITPEYDRAIEALSASSRVTIIGNGDAIIPCKMLGIKLMRMGISCFESEDSALQMLAASNAKSGDVVIAFSYSGRSKSVVEAVKKAYEQGATTIGITGSAKSPLLKYCSIVINTSPLDDSTDGDKISSRVGETLIVETLYIKLLNRSNEESRKKRIRVSEDINSLNMISDE